MNTVKYYHILLLPPANEVWGKVIFLHLSVILFTGGSASVHAGIPQPPPNQALPWTRHYLPPSRHLPTRHPPDQAPPGVDTPWSRHLPPEADTPQSRHPLTRHPPEQTHPPLPMACWEIQSTSGRYASYWNAILF